MPVYIDRLPELTIGLNLKSTKGSPFAFTTPDPRVLTANEYQALQDNFGRQYSYRQGGPAVPGTTRYVQWSELDRIMYDSTYVGLKALAVYYGMLGGELIYGFSRLKMIHTSGRLYDLSPTLETGGGAENPAHYLRSNGTIGPINEINWSVARDAYLRDVKVDRVGTGAFDDIDHVGKKDPKAIVLPWQSELQLLYFHNLPEMQGFAPWMRISSIAMVHGDVTPAGYRHGLGCNMGFVDGSGNWFDILGPGSSAVPSSYIYNQQAADLGNRCPPRCREYESPV